MKRGVAIGGFMGTGKSTVGRLVAERLGMRFVDLDQRVEQRAGRSVAGIFANEGEPGFRAHETRALAGILSENPSVIALGGGTLHHADNLARVKDCCVLVCLEAPLPTLRERVGDGRGRPNWDDVEDLYTARIPGYAAADHLVSTTDQTPTAVAERIIGLLK